MQQLETLDAQFLGVESPRTFTHFSVLGVYDPSTAPKGMVSVEGLCRLVGERLAVLPPFRWRLVEVPFNLDLPYWVEDPDFDLDFHIREAAVPPPGDDRHIADTVARICARPLDRSRPLWEMYLLHGLRDGRIGLLTKVHHALADGVSGNEILTALLDPGPDGRDEPYPPAQRPIDERPPTQLEMLGRGLRSIPRHPLRTALRLPRALPNITDVPGANAFPGVPRISSAMSRLRARAGREDPGILEIAAARAPRTSFNGPISAHRSFAFGSISLSRVKTIKNAAGTTVNDVLVALCASSLRAWLEEKGERPSDPLVAMIPVSVRGAEDQRSFGNRISFMVVPIPTDEPDPWAGLERAHASLKSAKEHHKALPAELLTDASSAIPPAMLALAARTTVDVLSRTRPPVNLVISNIPGPRDPLYLGGVALEAAFPLSVLVDGVGLNITVLSYRDHIDVGVVADRDQIHDTWPLMDGIKRALDELEAAVGGRTEST
jgi:diacylglycerol O-acyltransferase / wax synthase